MRKTVKDTAKKTAAKTVKAAETVKAAAEVVEKTVEEAAAKAEEVKETVKEEVKAVKKTAVAKKSALKEEVVLQWYGKEVNKDDLMKQVKEVWTKQMKNKVGDMKTVTLYLKPEENMVYYVINGEVTGSIEL